MIRAALDFPTRWEGVLDFPPFRLCEKEYLTFRPLGKDLQCYLNLITSYIPVEIPANMASSAGRRTADLSAVGIAKMFHDSPQSRTEVMNEINRRPPRANKYVHSHTPGNDTAAMNIEPNNNLLRSRAVYHIDIKSMVESANRDAGIKAYIIDKYLAMVSCSIILHFKIRLVLYLARNGVVYGESLAYLSVVASHRFAIMLIEDKYHPGTWRERCLSWPTYPNHSS